MENNQNKPIDVTEQHNEQTAIKSEPIRQQDEPVHKKSANHVMLLIVVLLLAIIAGLSYLLIQEEDSTTNQQTSNSATENAETPAAAEVEVDEKQEDSSDEFELITRSDLQFSFEYPIKWGEPTINHGPADSYVVSYRYNADLQYNIKSKTWVYANTDLNRSIESIEIGGNASELIGLYNILRKDNERTIWNFGFGDAGCGASVPTIVTGTEVVQIELPVYCDGGSEERSAYVIVGDNEIEMSSDEYDTLINTIIDSIQF